MHSLIALLLNKSFGLPVFLVSSFLFSLLFPFSLVLVNSVCILRSMPESFPVAIHISGSALRLACARIKAWNFSHLRQISSILSRIKILVAAEQLKV